MTYFRLITLGEFTLDPVVFLVHSFAANLARLLKFVFGITCSLYDYIYIFSMSVDRSNSSFKYVGLNTHFSSLPCSWNAWSLLNYSRFKIVSIHHVFDSNMLFRQVL